MTLVGYTDRLSAAPGQTVSFMVSSTEDTYDASIVRLVHGDVNPAGPGFREQEIETAVAGSYRGREQPIRPGSAVHVPDSTALSELRSFSFQAWVYPTTPGHGVEGLLTKWVDATPEGYGVFLDDHGDLALWVADARGRAEHLRTAAPLRSNTWYFVACSYDGDAGLARLYQVATRPWPFDSSEADVTLTTRVRPSGRNGAPLLIGAHWADLVSPRQSTGHFNGKIDKPRLFDRALTDAEILSLSAPVIGDALADAVIGAWDFSADPSSVRVPDSSRHAHHGETVNSPVRAVTGHNWTGRETNFAAAPDEYGAIHFHDDDLDDAGWEADFALTVPETLRSGIYAARLTTTSGDVDHVPFFVRPSRDTATARIAFVVPTFTYLAYANEHLGRATGGQRPDPSTALDQFLEGATDYERALFGYVVENRLLSVYERHSDGGGVCYSSRLRPILTMRPRCNRPSCEFRTPLEFNSDLYLADWLEAKGYEFDVVTDEDLHVEGVGLLAPYRVILTGTHPEYCSEQMLDALDEYLRIGGRLMYLGGNGFYWVTSVDPSRPHVVEVRRGESGTRSWQSAPGECHHSTTGELGGLWRSRGRAPQRSVGVGFTAVGIDRSSGYRRSSASLTARAAFIFEGVHDDEVIGDFGLYLGGAAGYEIDRADAELGTPPHALVVASSFGHSDGYQHVVEEVTEMNPSQGGAQSALVRADLVYVDYPRGGAVFSVGSVAWCGSLSHDGYDNNVSRITENVLRRFAEID
jgi:N,N-dimethylformamidase